MVTWERQSEGGAKAIGKSRGGVVVAEGGKAGLGKAEGRGHMGEMYEGGKCLMGRGHILGVWPWLRAEPMLGLGKNEGAWSHWRAGLSRTRQAGPKAGYEGQGQMRVRRGPSHKVGGMARQKREGRMRGRP